MSSPDGHGVLGEWRTLYHEFLNAERAMEAAQQTLSSQSLGASSQAPLDELRRAGVAMSNHAQMLVHAAAERWAEAAVPLPGDIMSSMVAEAMADDATAVEEELLRRLAQASPGPRVTFRPQVLDPPKPSAAPHLRARERPHEPPASSSCPQAPLFSTQPRPAAPPPPLAPQQRSFSPTVVMPGSLAISQPHNAQRSATRAQHAAVPTRASMPANLTPASSSRAAAALPSGTAGMPQHQHPGAAPRPQALPHHQRNPSQPAPGVVRASMPMPDTAPWSPGYRPAQQQAYAAAAATSVRQPPESTTALRRAMSMRVSPGRASVATSCRDRSRDPSPGPASARGARSGSGMTSPGYAVRHIQRQGSPPRQVSPASREEIFEALHRGVSPHRARLLQSVAAQPGPQAARMAWASLEQRSSAPAVQQQQRPQRPHQQDQQGPLSARGSSQQQPQRWASARSRPLEQPPPQRQQQQRPGVAESWLASPWEEAARPGAVDAAHVAAAAQRGATTGEPVLPRRGILRNSAGERRAQQPQQQDAPQRGSGSMPAAVADMHGFMEPMEAAVRSRSPSPHGAYRHMLQLQSHVAASSSAAAGGQSHGQAQQRQGPGAAAAARSVERRRPAGPLLPADHWPQEHVSSSPVDPPSPDLFISPKAYREYAAGSFGGAVSMSARPPTEAPPTGDVGDVARTVPHAVSASVAGPPGFPQPLDDAAAFAGGRPFRGRQQRFSGDLERAAAEGPVGEPPRPARPASPAATPRVDMQPQPQLRSPDAFEEQRPAAVSYNDMAAALEEGAMPYAWAAPPPPPLAPSSAAVAAAAEEVGASPLPSSMGGGIQAAVHGAGVRGVLASEPVSPGTFERQQNEEFEFYEAMADAQAQARGRRLGAEAPSMPANYPQRPPPPAAAAAPHPLAFASPAAPHHPFSLQLPSALHAHQRTHVHSNGGNLWGLQQHLHPSLVHAAPTSHGGAHAGVGGGAGGSGSSAGPVGLSEAALSAAGVAVVATAISSARSSSSSVSGGAMTSSGGQPDEPQQDGLDGHAGALTHGSPVAGVLDAAALTEQLSHMDVASLEVIRGYASGYIDGRVQALQQQSGQVRSQVVKAAVLRLVEEALQAKRQAAAAAVAATDVQPAPAPTPVAAAAAPAAAPATSLVPPATTVMAAAAMPPTSIIMEAPVAEGLRRAAWDREHTLEERMRQAARTASEGELPAIDPEQAALLPTHQQHPQPPQQHLPYFHYSAAAAAIAAVRAASGSARPSTHAAVAAALASPRSPGACSSQSSVTTGGFSPSKAARSSSGGGGSGPYALPYGHPLSDRWSLHGAASDGPQTGAAAVHDGEGTGGDESAAAASVYDVDNSNDGASAPYGSCEEPQELQSLQQQPVDAVPPLVTDAAAGPSSHGGGASVYIAAAAAAAAAAPIVAEWAGHSLPDTAAAERHALSRDQDAEGSAAVHSWPEHLREQTAAPSGAAVDSDSAIAAPAPAVMQPMLEEHVGHAISPSCTDSGSAVNIGTAAASRSVSTSGGLPHHRMSASPASSSPRGQSPRPGVGSVLRASADSVALGRTFRSPPSASSPRSSGGGSSVPRSNQHHHHHPATYTPSSSASPHRYHAYTGIVLSKPASAAFHSPPGSPASARPPKLQALSPASSYAPKASPRERPSTALASARTLSSGRSGASGSSRAAGASELGAVEQLRSDSMRFVMQLEAAIAAEAVPADVEEVTEAALQADMVTEAATEAEEDVVAAAARSATAEAQEAVEVEEEAGGLAEAQLAAVGKVTSLATEGGAVALEPLTAVNHAEIEGDTGEHHQHPAGDDEAVIPPQLPRETEEVRLSFGEEDAAWPPAEPAAVSESELALEPQAVPQDVVAEDVAGEGCEGCLHTATTATMDLYGKARVSSEGAAPAEAVDDVRQEEPIDNDAAATVEETEMSQEGLIAAASVTAYGAPPSAAADDDGSLAVPAASPPAAEATVTDVVGLPSQLSLQLPAAEVEASPEGASELGAQEAPETDLAVEAASASVPQDTAFAAPPASAAAMPAPGPGRSPGTTTPSDDMPPPPPPAMMSASASPPPPLPPPPPASQAPPEPLQTASSANVAPVPQHAAANTGANLDGESELAAPASASASTAAPLQQQQQQDAAQATVRSVSAPDHLTSGHKACNNTYDGSSNTSSEVLATVSLSGTGMAPVEASHNLTTLPKALPTVEAAVLPATPEISAAEGEPPNTSPQPSQPSTAALETTVPPPAVPAPAGAAAAAVKTAPASVAAVADGGAAADAPASEPERGLRTSSSPTTLKAAVAAATAAAAAAAAAEPTSSSSGTTTPSSGTATPTRPKSRDARSIEPVLTELRAVRTAMSMGDPDGSRAVRMAELLGQLDTYRRGVERRHGPQHSIASQLRILHADMSKWLQAAVATAAAGGGGPAKTVAATTSAAVASSSSSSAQPTKATTTSTSRRASAAAAAARAGNGLHYTAVTLKLGGVGVSVAPSSTGLQGSTASHGSSSSQPQSQPQLLPPPPQQQPPLTSHESQSSVGSDATFDLAASTGGTTPRDSLHVTLPDGFTFPQHAQELPQQQQQGQQP
ncbi:hypothetical protein Agub_g6201, partial [Astrephomene gubernaculifera]